MAEDEERSPGTDNPTVSVADGRAKHRAAEGTQAGDRAEYDMIKGPVENAGLSGIFVVE